MVFGLPEGEETQAPIAFSFSMNQVVDRTNYRWHQNWLTQSRNIYWVWHLGCRCGPFCRNQGKERLPVMVLGDLVIVFISSITGGLGSWATLKAWRNERTLNDWSIIGIDENKNYYDFLTCDIGLKLCNTRLHWRRQAVCLNNEGLQPHLASRKGFRADKLARPGSWACLKTGRLSLTVTGTSQFFEELTNFGVVAMTIVDALVWLVNGLARKGSCTSITKRRIKKRLVQWSRVIGQP